MFGGDDDDDLPEGGEGEGEELDQEGDEPEEGDEEGEEGPTEDEPQPEPQPQDPPRRNTANERVRTAIAKQREAESRLAEKDRLILEMQQAHVRPAAPVEDPVAERNRLEQMSEVERTQYVVNKVLANDRLRVQQLELRYQVDDDRRKFERVLTAKPELSRFEDHVEQEFARCMKIGQPRTREELLDKAIGQEIREKGAAALTKARRQGDESLRRQGIRPSSARGSRPAGGKSQAGMSAEERLIANLSTGAYQGQF